MLVLEDAVCIFLALASGFRALHSNWYRADTEKAVQFLQPISSYLSNIPYLVDTCRFSSMKRPLYLWGFGKNCNEDNENFFPHLVSSIVNFPASFDSFINLFI